jgi:hypothetical protein
MRLLSYAHAGLPAVCGAALQLDSNPG